MGSEDPDAGPDEDVCHQARLCIAEALNDGLGPFEMPIYQSDMPTTVYGGLLARWAAAARDPDLEAASWFENGAPAGLDIHIPACGIFPEQSLEHDDPSALIDLQDDSCFANYEGIEDNDDAATAIFGLRDKDMIQEFASLDDVKSYLGETPILSKVGAIKRPSGPDRIIVDSNRSGVSLATNKPERVVLPRQTDLIEDALQHLATHEQHPGVTSEFMVLDFSNAFFIVPLRREERKYFVIQFRSKFYVFKVMAQGASASPLCWGRVAALIARLTQAMFVAHDEMSLQVFVDDPCAVVSGSRIARDTIITTIILVWRALGFPLSFKKGQRGSRVVWIGNTFKFMPTSVVASVKPETLQTLERQCREIVQLNMVPKKTVRSLAGRTNHVATLLWAWRPFLQAIWASLSSSATHAPRGYIWTKQFSHAVEWILAFLAGTQGSIIRTFWVDAYLNRGEPVRLLLDASPWGYGGILEVFGEAMEWFACPIQAADISVLKIEVGSCTAQQAVESMAALIALRQWSPKWNQRRIQLQVTGDSVCMLTLLLKMRPASNSHALGIIAREVALDIAACVYLPDVVEHVPGISNITPDLLSRRYDPAHQATWSVPSCLKHVRESIIADRSNGFFKTI